MIGPAIGAIIMGVMITAITGIMIADGKGCAPCVGGECHALRYAM
jgi:hypothetical protein